MVKSIDATSVSREEMPSYRKKSGLLDSIFDSWDTYPRKKGGEYDTRNTARQQGEERAYQKTKEGMYSGRGGSSSEQAKSRASNREAMYGSQKYPVPDQPSKPSVSVEKASPTKEEPAAVIKKTEIVKTAPVVSRKSTPSAPARKSMSEDQRIRDAIESMRGQYESGDLYNKTGLEKSAQDANTAEDMNTEGKLDAVEPVTINAKKGGMTKRPPKPAKKVPPRKFASGGSTSRTSASKRGDGCATKGHTKGNMR
jgi:hypothetical protein